MKTITHKILSAIILGWLVLGAACVLVLFSGCQKLQDQAVALVPAPATVVSNAVLPILNPQSPIPNAVAAWPAYRCANFFVHSQPGEDQVRLDAFAATRAAGLDCIECDAAFDMPDELGMHLLKLQHPDIPDYYLRKLLAKQRTDGWYFKAQRAGITRWIHWLGTPSLAQAQRWLWLVKDYAPAELQLKLSSATPADVQQLILSNTNQLGVVIMEVAQ